MSDVSGSGSLHSRRRSVDTLPGVEAFLRRRGSTSQIFGPSSLNDLEGYVNKRRMSSVGLVQLGEKDNIFRDSTSLSLSKEHFSSGPLWEKGIAQGENNNLVDPETDRKKSKKKMNLLDKRTLYSITKEMIAGQDLQFPDKPIIGEDDNKVNNVEQKIEREYILKSGLRDNVQAKFENAIMRRFYKAPAPKAHPGYGMPRPETREENPFRLIMDDLQRDPSIVHINKYPSLSNPQRCKNTNDFCEVLGPACCSTCIETTNRYIAEELQRIMFPKIDMNRTRLVKPKLSRVMRHGHQLQVRKKKMADMEYPDDIAMSLRRQETQLSRITKSAATRYTISRKSKKSKRTPKINHRLDPLDLTVISEDDRKLVAATR